MIIHIAMTTVWTGKSIYQSKDFNLKTHCASCYWWKQTSQCQLESIIRTSSFLQVPCTGMYAYISSQSFPCFLHRNGRNTMQTMCMIFFVSKWHALFWNGIIFTALFILKQTTKKKKKQSKHLSKPSIMMACDHHRHDDSISLKVLIL